MGEVAVTKALSGHSTNRVKLKKNPALIWYSLRVCAEAKLLPAGDSMRKRMSKGDIPFRVRNWEKAGRWSR
jgi:hypothetical protein